MRTKLRLPGLMTQMVVGLMLAVTAVSSTFAASQRMMIPPQTIRVGPGGSSSADAMCLDAYADTPREGMAYSAAPTTLGDIVVSVPGRGEMPLQSAIDAKLVAVSGTGDFSSLNFRSLVNNGEISITVKRNSVVLPTKSDSTADLDGLPQLKSGAAPVDQLGLWHAREQHARTQLQGLAISEDYDFSWDEILAAEKWTQSQALERPNQRAILLHRLTSIESSAPLYLLMTRDGQPQVFKGNGALREASAAAINAWKAAGNAEPVRLVMTGDGGTKDFDAARLVLETSAGGNGGGELIGPQRPSAFNFEPPQNRPPVEGIYSGEPWEKLRVAWTQDRYRATQDVYDRGSVTVISRTVELLGRMAAVARAVIRGTPELATASSDEVINALRSKIAREVKEARADSPTLSAFEGRVPSATFSIDGTVRSVRFGVVLPASRDQELAFVPSER